MEVERGSFQVFGTFGTLQSKQKNQISLLCSMFGKIPVEVRPPVRSHKFGCQLHSILDFSLETHEYS